MHSRVFAMSKDTTTEFAMPEYFCPTYCDYYDDSEDPISDIEWLADSLIPLGVQFEVDNEKIIFRNVDGYFDHAYKRFRSAVEMLNKISRADFQNIGCYIEEHEINSALSDECGFWFMLYDECPETMQHFMRQVELDVPYYITTVYDYHY